MAAAKLKQYMPIYIMLIPVAAFYIIFEYKPLYGIIIAFKDFRLGNTILNAPWVGMANFDFLTRPDFLNVLRNTLAITSMRLIFGFPF